MSLTPYSVLFWSCDNILKRCILYCVLIVAGSPSTATVSQWMKEPRLIPDKQLQKQVILVIHHDRGCTKSLPGFVCPDTKHNLYNWWWVTTCLQAGSTFHCPVSLYCGNIIGWSTFKPQCNFVYMILTSYCYTFVCSVSSMMQIMDC